jgi:hypothetical protein
MCCKVLHIAELAKPANQWCRHIARGGGCSIYDERFEICRGYRCLWLTDEGFGPDWQPNHCKFIMHQVAGNKGIWVNVDITSPHAWRQDPYYAQLKALSEMARDGSGFVAVCVGQRTFILFPEEDLEIADCPSDADLKVGYRHGGGARRPLVMVRSEDGSIREFLGSDVSGAPTFFAK